MARHAGQKADAGTKIAGSFVTLRDTLCLVQEGMMQGVADSDDFLLVLTSDVLGRWYCQREILKAIELNKKVHLLIEEDLRFSAFPRKTWSDWVKSKRKAVMKFTNRDDRTKESTIPKELYDDLSTLYNDLSTLHSRGWKDPEELYVFKDESGNVSEIPALICDKIDECLDNAVPFRRRDFEYARVSSAAHCISCIAV